MNIYDGLKLKGAPVEIPDSTRDDLPDFLWKMGYKTGAEIGVYKGQFTTKLCRSGLKIYAIDPWIAYSDYQADRIGYQERQNDLYIITKKALATFQNCTIIRKTSMEALADFDDESLDFVYIDGNHMFSYVAQDICGWSKKVKSGGAVIGRCYRSLRPPANHDKVCQSRFVVEAYTKAYRISNWYTFGRFDKLLAWFWIKE